MAFSCLAEFDQKYALFWHEEYRSRFDFFMAVFATGWIVVLCVFLTFIFVSEGNITTGKNWDILVSISVPLMWIESDWNLFEKYLNLTEKKPARNDP